MQTPKAILMVRPSAMTSNTETANSNSFQNPHIELVENQVLNEFDRAVETLSEAGIDVIVIEDTPEPPKPDAIFPNNWFSTHPDGTVVLYPMMAENRRAERRLDIIDDLRKRYKITKVIDLSEYEKDNRFLEGTGSIIFDFDNACAYANTSPRTDISLFEKLCSGLNVKPVSFKATDLKGQDLYHTNVLMSIAKEYVVICLECIESTIERSMIKQNLKQSGKEIIEISYTQLNNFGGNCIEVSDQNGKSKLVMSERAYKALDKDHIKKINQYSDIVSYDLEGIEKIGGGSARCMIAGIHLPEN